MSERITTAEELDALPVGSVVVEGDHTTPDASGLGFEVIPGVFHRFPSGWYVVAGHGPRDVPLPARLLHRPDAPVTAGGGVTREHDAAAARKADDAAGGYGYRASPAWRRAYLTALGLTVVDGPTGEGEQ